VRDPATSAYLNASLVPERSLGHIGKGRLGKVNRIVAAAITYPEVAVACAASSVNSHDLAGVVDPEGSGQGRAGKVECSVAPPLNRYP